MYTWIETKSLRRKLDKDVYATGRHCIIFAKYVGQKWILDPQRGIYGTFSHTKTGLTNNNWLEKQNILPGGRRLVNINILMSDPGLIYSNGQFFTHKVWDFLKEHITSKELRDLGLQPPASWVAEPTQHRRKLLKQLGAARADFAGAHGAGTPTWANRVVFRFSSSSHKLRRKLHQRRKSQRRKSKRKSKRKKSRRKKFLRNFFFNYK